MNKNQMKNIVILKNLPSNLIEEAIVVLKSKNAVKKIEFIEKKEISNKEEKNKENYIIREAENIISNCIKNSEDEDKQNIKKKFLKKYKYLKIYSLIITIVLVLMCVL